MNAEGHSGEGDVEYEGVRGGLSFEEIAARAYEIYAAGSGGDDVANWFLAERQLSAELASDRGWEADRYGLAEV
jgi:hypothetical protein